MTPQTKRRVYLREATIALLLARLAVRFLPSARLLEWSARPVRNVHRFGTEDAEWVAWAIDHAATKRGMNALCLPRALAAQAMLRHRGIASRLCLGIARNENQVSAHAWIEIGERKLTGGDEAGRFTPLAAFGGAKT
ncbi:lasso peptide biosynthesis B2 protein [Pseudorhodoplanes sp.]|uniref:lasso peptide biosynthesis B2 protein n=1 Tax=Pseudorhodoplanes sp. TaxID=1934341 RepID=UPI002CEE3915|nr:lasso peptide biosynthesis B2 protein [Pseudorhodoplanes sp.]HWV52540.1 lasso peptide biosynthesis B2 protein [Pseudorhodoplanes sp.]